MGHPAVGREGEPQVPPLRYAPVGMTIQLAPNRAPDPLGALFLPAPVPARTFL